MFRLNRVLIKRGFKSIVNSKAFSILMMILLIITGTAYTMLSSSANAFKSSYDNVVNNGNLHQYVVKYNFVSDANTLNKSKTNFVLVDENGQDLPLLNNQINGKDVEDLVKKFIKKNKNSKQPSIKIMIKAPQVNADGSQNIYSDFDGQTKTIIFSNYSKTNMNLNLNVIKSEIEAWKDEINSDLRKNLSTQFVGQVRHDYKDKLFVKDVQSLYVEKEREAFKVVAYEKPFEEKGNQFQEVNTMIKYDGEADFTIPLSDDQFQEIVRYQILASGQKETDYQVNNLKGYKWTATKKSGFGNNTITVTDPSAYQAIISPAYANYKNKISIGIKEVARLFEKDPYFMDKLSENKYLQNKYASNLIFVGDTPYFITGIGTTPDFMYPILDQSKPIVDSTTQAVVFVNKKGYQRLHDAFRSNPTENYVSIRFKPHVAKEEQQNILKEIEQNLITGQKQGKQVGVYPTNVFARTDGIKLITSYDDPDDQLLLTQERASTLPKISSTVVTLSYVTTTLLVIFLIFISIMIFKTLISGSKKAYATLHALGYTKTQIAISNALTAIVIGIIPMAISYAIGYGGQFIFMDTFASAWTIPAYANSFSWMTLLIMMVFPTVILFSIIFATTIFEMKGTIPDMLSGNLSKSRNLNVWLTSWINFLGIKTKYVLSLSARNIGKLLLIVVTSVISLTSLIVGMGTIGRANQAYAATNMINNYEFAISLATPTKEGQEYKAIRPLDTSDLNNKNNIPSLYNPPTKPHSLNWYLPSSSDLSYSDPTNASSPANLIQASEFLKDKLQHKATLKLGTIGSIDPWSIAERLMPDNQKNQANKDYEKIINSIPGIGLQSKSTLTNAEKNSIKKRIDQLTQDKQDTPYIISYGGIIIDKDDELYTHIDSYLKGHNKKVSIKGINEQTKMIRISHNLLKQLNLIYDKDKTYIPILINKYIQANLKIDEGDILDIQIDNVFDNGSPPKKLKVVGIIDGYNDLGFYTSKKIANSVLGMSSQGFNGVFTKSQKPKALSTLSLYSKSGIYPATDSFVGKWKPFLEKYLQSRKWKDKQVKDNDGQLIQTADQFIRKYSETPYASVVSRVRWNAIDKTTFKNVTKLSSTILNIIETISIILSIIFTLIVAILMFRINRKKISALWSMGYRKREISTMFLSMYLIPTIVAFIIAIPISFAVLSALKILIMNFGHILIPLSISWWMPIVALLGVSLIFIISTFATIFTQKASNSLDAFKGD